MRKGKTQPMVAILVVTVGTVILVGSLSHCRAADPVERGRDNLNPVQRRLLMRSLQGRFILKGTVVDDAGDPLDDVGLQIGKDTAPVLIFDKLRSSSEEYRINRQFSLDLRGHVGVHLTFTKEGYYPEELDFGIRAVEDSSEPGQRPVVRAESLRVVLLKEGATTTLTRYEGRLEYSADGRGQVINTGDVLQSKNPLRTVSMLPGTSKLRRGDLYMVASRNERGEILTVTRKLDQQLAVAVPAETVLSVHDGQTAFVGPMEGDPSVMYRQLRTMRTAPLRGYTRSLLLPAESFPHSGFKSRYAYFYFQVAGKYGKGILQRARLREDTVSLTVVLLLQPDGSRNLEDPTAY